MDGERRRPAHTPGSKTLKLRVLVADERPGPLERMADVARSRGHGVVALELGVEEAARAIRDQAPDLAIVGLHKDEAHALELVEQIVDEGICPVIVQSNGEDPEFAARAAARGAFAFTTPVEADALQAAIEVAVRRYEELEELSEQVENLEGAIQRRA